MLVVCSLGRPGDLGHLGWRPLGSGDAVSPPLIVHMHAIPPMWNTRRAGYDVSSRHADHRERIRDGRVFRPVDAHEMLIIAAGQESTWHDQPAAATENARVRVHCWLPRRGQ